MDSTGRRWERRAERLRAAEGEAGAYNVELLSNALPTFVNHKPDRYRSYGFAAGVGQSPLHERELEILKVARQRELADGLPPSPVLGLARGQLLAEPVQLAASRADPCPGQAAGQAVG